MAGKNQHYIPQFLQKGFSQTTSAIGFAKSTTSNKGDSKVWVFEKQKSYPTHPRNKGSERFFYGLENSVLDQTITDAEKSYSKIINNLRMYSEDTLLECDGLPELVAHMLVRSKNIRQTASDIGEMALDVLGQSMLNSDAWIEFLIKYIQENPNKIGEGSLLEQRQLVGKMIQDNPEFIRKL